MAAVTSSVPLAAVELAMLQRGRRSMAAVTCPHACGPEVFALASTGPPLDGGGDRPLARRRQARQERFNGAAARWRR